MRPVLLLISSVLIVLGDVSSALSEEVLASSFTVPVAGSAAIDQPVERAFATSAVSGSVIPQPDAWAISLQNNTATEQQITARLDQLGVQGESLTSERLDVTLDPGEVERQTLNRQGPNAVLVLEQMVAR